jgi:hypothetical protein
MKILFLVAALFSAPVFANIQMEERIVYIRNGQAFTMWMKKTDKAVLNQPAPCLENITVRIEHGQPLTVLNPHYAKCILEQSAKVNAQERGGDDN